MIIQRKVLIILSAVIVLLFVATLLIINHRPQNSESMPNTVPTSITKFKDLSEIMSIKVKNNKGEYTIVPNQSKGFTIEGLRDKPLSEDLIMGFVRTVSNLQAHATVEDNCSNMEKYSLDKPIASATLSYKNSDKITIYLGSMSRVSQSYYFTTNKTPKKVFFMEASIGQQLLKDIVDYRGRELYPKMDTANVKELKYIKISGKNIKTMIFEQKPLINKTISPEYKMVEPVYHDTNSEDFTNSILTKLAVLSTADEFVSDNPVLKQYGLDDPEFSLQLKYMGKDSTILVSRAEVDKRYIMKKGDSSVFSINKDKAEFFNTDYKTAIGRAVFTSNITTVSKISFVFEKKESAFDITGGGADLNIKIGGKEVLVGDFMNMFKKVNSIGIEGEAQKPKGVEPYLIIKVYYRSGQNEDILQFIPVGDRQYAIDINGRTYFYTYKKVVSDITKDLESIAR